MRQQVLDWAITMLFRDLLGMLCFRDIMTPSQKSVIGLPRISSSYTSCSLSLSLFFPCPSSGPRRVAPPLSRPQSQQTEALQFVRRPFPLRPSPGMCMCIRQPAVARLGTSAAATRPIIHPLVCVSLQPLSRMRVTASVKSCSTEDHKNQNRTGPDWTGLDWTVCVVGS